MSMPELSPADAARARKIEAQILNRLASVGQARIAEQLGINESTVSRWKDGEIARFAKFLALLGLKATPQEYKCYDEKTLEAMLTLAQQRMSQIRGVDHLAFEDDE
jgi:predicted XRE-type DNA-binding protein